MPSLRYRWFGYGRFPDSVAALAVAPGTLFAEDGLSMKVTARGLHLVGRRVSHSVTMSSGALILAPSRIVLSIGKRVVLDGRYDADAPTAAAGVTVGGRGIHFDVDVPKAEPAGMGTMTVEVYVSITPQLRASLSDGAHVAMTSADVMNLSRFT